ncbi:MAG: peptidylprolyl isomerase [Gammaproteobacteria bacterium]|nr:peptidylprolyl isomerase [Gammaproteobacteria bacterium]NNF62057.1 peptidyl-prolyl cis-trans isomerase [Gammaproteobacteria bacterium]NNM20668.1 peptidyl-prolyl cis-trans isomerase [Gammaproteobacteria bacterium]
MKTIVTLVLTGLLASVSNAAENNLPLFPQVEVKTTEGDFTLELDGRRAPVTVSNFVQYVIDGHYDGTVFHRVIPGFVAQAGGYDEGLQERKTRQPIPNESGNGLSNVRGTIALARMGHPHSGKAQFYINLGDNQRLDPNPSRWGYCVFGEVIAGMETLDSIAAIPTGASGPFRGDFPQKMVKIISARLVTDKPAAAE